MSQDIQVSRPSLLDAISSWWMLVVLLVLYILSLLDRITLVMLVDPMKATLHLSDFQMSLILGPAFGFLYALFAMPLGWAADKFPRRIVIVLGMAASGVATMACGWVSSFPALFGARAIVGVGEAALSPAAYSLIADKYSRERLATALAVYGTGPKIGNAVVFSVAAALIAITSRMSPQALGRLGASQPWQFILISVGATAMLLSLVTFTFREPARRGRAGGGSTDNLWLFVRGNGRLMFGLLLGLGISALVTSALLNWTPTYIHRRFGLPPTAIGPTLSAISLFMAAAVIVKGAAMDWLYARGVRDAALRFYLWLLIPALIAAVPAFLAPSPTVFYVLFTVVEIAVTGFTLNMSIIVQLMAPTFLRSQLAALFLLVINISASCGPPAVAAITDFVFKDDAKVGTSLAIVTAVGILGSLVALGLVLPLFRRQVTETLAPAAAD